METTVTVKVVPRNGSWETAHEIIKRIAETCEIGDRLHIEVADVFHANTDSQVSAGNVNQYGDHCHASPIVNIQTGGGT